jgi:hypothetical protein
MPALALEHQQYAEFSYPSNHTYKIAQNQLIPKMELAARYKKIRELYPEKLESLVDIGCCKGYFNFSAAEQPYCERSLGIDVMEKSINHCHAVEKHIGSKNTRFSLLKLHELADSISNYGGQFQTVLVINQYQYLYFGSDSIYDCYLNHDVIFKHLRNICSQRVIFSNRITRESCQNKERILLNEKHADNYTEEKIIQAASKYFVVSKHGTLGRYPLWTLDVE